MKDNREIVLDKNIQLYMERYCLSLSHLARACKVNKSSLHSWVYGIKPKSLEQLIKISRYFEITLDELVFNPNFDPSRNKQGTFLTEGRFEIEVKKIR